MISSYKKDLRIRAWKNGLFWVVVFVFAGFLQLFFQGYYVNYSGLLHPETESKRAFLKPFGIIDMHVSPSPDAIYVGKRGYVNNAKEIYDLGNYTVSVYKSGYLNPEFPISITAKNPFYTNTFRLVPMPEYRSTGFDFDRMELVDGVIYAVSPQNVLFVLDRDMKVLRAIPLVDHRYVGKGYFTNGVLLLSYDYVSGQFRVATEPANPNGTVCPDWEMYGDMPHCRSTGKILDLRDRIGINEHTILSSPSIVFTDKYIHNTEAYGDWRSYEYANPLIVTPSALVHLYNIPFVIQSGSLVPLEATVATREAMASGSVRLDEVFSAKRFGDESFFLGKYQGKSAFSISHGDRKWWYGSLGDIDLRDVRVDRVDDVYVLSGTSGAYVYYRGSKTVFRIISDPVTAAIDGKIYFRKDGKTQVIDIRSK